MPEKRNENLTIKVRLRAGEHDDLIAWYRSLPNAPFGAKAEAVRALLRAGLGQQINGVLGDYGDLVEQIRVEIRQVVEALLESYFARLPTILSVPEQDDPDQDDVIDAVLDEIGLALVLEE